MFKSLAVQKLSQSINKILATDPLTLALFAKLRGQSLRVQVLKTPFDVLVFFYETGVEIKPYDHHQVPTVSLAGTPTALLKFAKTDSHTQMLMDKEIKIVGDLDLLMDVKKIQANLMIDWEGLLAEYVGDFAANRIHLLVRKAKERLKQHLTLMQADTLDYVQHEVQLLPTALEVNQFYDDLRILRHGIERFERKIT